MPYIQDASSLVIEVLLGLFLVAAILRFLFQLFRLDFRNPIFQAIVTVTNPPLKILRRFIPGLYGIDVASLVLILLTAILKLYLLSAVAGITPSLGGIVVAALAEALNITCWILLIAIFASAILSWVAPRSYHPAISMVNELSQPVLSPFRRLLPAMGGLDLTPIFAILAINLVQRLLVSPLFDYARQLV